MVGLIRPSMLFDEYCYEVTELRLGIPRPSKLSKLFVQRPKYGLHGFMQVVFFKISFVNMYK